MIVAEWTASASWVAGDEGAEGGSRQYRTFTGGGRLNVAIPGGASLYVGYGYVSQNLGVAVDLVGRVPGIHHRQTIDAGVAVGLPLLRERVGERK